MSKKKMQTELTILSYGAGQDSTALRDLYVFDKAFRKKYAPGRMMMICSDTGDEHLATYAHIEETKEFCEKHGIEFHHLTADKGFHSESWPSLREFYRRTNTVGSKAFPKTCTDRLKLQPIYRFLEHWLAENYGVRCSRKKGFYEFAEQYGKINMLIGIAAGEEKRVADPEKGPCKWRRETVQNVYPLIDLGMDRKACQDYIRSVGNKVPPPSNCILCPFMNEVELVWLYRNQPHDFQEWVDIEQTKLSHNLDKGDRNLGVWGKKYLPEVLTGALARFGHMTMEALDEYKMSHGHCVMSKY